MTSHTASVVVWAVLAATVVGLGVVSFTATGIAGHRVARPGAVVRSLLANRWLRVAVLLGWMWVGWHLFAR
jgi:uncharacterized protein DUF6186